jgi:hypothetical protein
MSDERPVCPSCHQDLISYRDGCGSCGWQGIPVQVKQQGIILRDLGDKFEIALNDGSVGVYHKLYVYPSVDAGDVRQPNFPLEKADATLRRRTDGAYKVRTQVPHTAPPQRNAHQARKRPPSGTLYSYIATRWNKRGIEKQYRYWAYSYEVKDPKTGQWETKKKSVSRGKRERVSYAIAQNKPVEYILSILDGKA